MTGHWMGTYPELMSLSLQRQHGEEEPNAESEADQKQLGSQKLDRVLRKVSEATNGKLIGQEDIYAIKERISDLGIDAEMAADAIGAIFTDPSDH